VLEFLDHQETAVVFDDGGDGDVGFPVHEVFLNFECCNTVIVGAGLLSDSGGSVNIDALNDKPLSRASQLPQGFELQLIPETQTPALGRGL
jgi:hypothetical protein